MPRKSPAKGPVKDPHAKREAQNYDNPVPSREFMLVQLEKAGPKTHPQMCELLGIDNEEQIEAVRRRLIAMVRDGQLICNRKQQFGSIHKMDLVKGRVLGHRDGFGFLVPEDDSGKAGAPNKGQDIFLSPKQMQLVFDGDRALVRINGEDRRGRKEGAIVEVLEHNTKEVVGRYFTAGDGGWVVPDSQKICHEITIDKAHKNGAVHGEIVVVELLNQPARHVRLEGKVKEVLGDHLAPGMEIDVAVRSHQIPHEWPAQVVRAARAFGKEVIDADKQGRHDLTHLPFVTIDGEDAKDFDDAVYAEPAKNGGFYLWVAIADVASYVEVDGSLDQEAAVRGNSVYFPGKVIPMLPEELSNGLCSLNPKVDRLAMVCRMRLTRTGKLAEYQFMEGVIHSHARLTYHQAYAILGEPDSPSGRALRKQHHIAVDNLEALYSLYHILLAKRHKRGALDFDTTETQILFNADRKIQAILPVQRNDAHKLIEECMLCANVAAATFLKEHELPGLYRNHAGPNEDKLAALKLFLGELGLVMGGGKEPKPSDYLKFLEQLEDRPDKHLIQTVVLRSMQQARYEVGSIGHFGLAYEDYTHFTSPIRRYPDLLTHRAIKHVIRSRKKSEFVERARGAKVLPKKLIYPYSELDVNRIGDQCSMTERRADDATRDVSAFLKCEYIRAHVGEVFEGIVSAVTGFGLFVELKDVFVEGLVHVSTLKSDYYHFDSGKHRLVGEHSGRAYRLGDSLQVQVVRVDLEQRKVDLELLDESGSEPGKPKSKNAGSKKLSTREAFMADMKKEQGSSKGAQDGRQSQSKRKPGGKPKPGPKGKGKTRGAKGSKTKGSSSSKRPKKK